MLRRTLIQALSGVGMLVSAAAAWGYTAGIDEFKVIRDGSTYFLDAFGDGLEPPQSPAQASTFGCGTTCYFTTAGGFPDGSETGGRLQMNTAFGVNSANAVGTPVMTQRATLFLSTAPAPNQGLQAHRTFEVSALFDLNIPGAGETLSLVLADRVTGNTMDDYVQIQLANPGGTGPQIRFREQDFVANVITQFDSDPISAASGDQVRLILSHPTANTNTIFAAYEFFKTGVSQGIVSMSGSVDIYSDEIWTRPEFVISAVVPEPETYLLMAIGLALVSGMAARARRRASVSA